MKQWVEDHSQADEEAFVDYCEELIPFSERSSYQWLIEQSVSWHRFVVASRKSSQILEGDDD
jgi:hypothetical protein